jgi:parvulin-like peptidyl-prolyl isomerase
MLKKTKEVKLSTILYSILILLLGYFVVIAVMLYGFGIKNTFIKKTLQFLPYPAAFVGSTSYISIGDLENELNAVKSFYENQDFSDLGYRVDFSTEDGKKRLLIKERKLLNKLIENRIIERFSNKSGITIDNEIISKEVDKNIEQYGTKEEVLGNLKKLYGWDLDDFKKKVVKPDMYKEALTKYIQDNDKDILISRNKAEAALLELNDGKDFAEVASKYSEGESAKNGGDLGWLSADQMIPEIALTSALLKTGAISNVLKTPLGFHIIKMEDKKTENGLEMFKIKQVFIKALNFSDWLMEQEKNTKIYIPLKDFYWDTKTQTVRFKDKKLEDFENNLNENSAGDISVMF